MTDDTDPLQPEPRANPDLFGHEAAERLIADTVKGGRVHHAWLISGPKGIGKATLAYRFARHLLAEAAKDSAPEAPEAPGLFGDLPADEGTGEKNHESPLWLDPASPLFQRIAAAGHSDLMTLERGFDDQGKKRRSEIVIGDVRRVSHFLSLTASEGGWRVVIVDGAEDMNRNAANALLKTLEEPPPRTLLLLVSHAPGRLLATIRSRCRRLALNPLDDDTTTRLIRHYRPDVDAGDAALLGTIAEGAIGRALRLHDAGGVALYGEMVSLLDGLPQPDGARLHGIADAIARSRGDNGAFEAFDVFSELLDWWITRMVRGRATGQAPKALVAGEAEIMARLGAAGSLDQWVEVWEKITHLFTRTNRVNLDRKQVLLNAFFTMGRIGA